jgi:hypothetical protein
MGRPNELLADLTALWIKVLETNLARCMFVGHQSSEISASEIEKFLMSSWQKFHKFHKFSMITTKCIDIKRTAARTTQIKSKVRLKP